MKIIALTFVFGIAAIVLTTWCLWLTPPLKAEDCLQWERVMLKHGDHQHSFVKCLKSEPHWAPAGLVPE